MAIWMIRALCLIHVVGGFSPPPPSLSLLGHEAQRPSLGSRLPSEKVGWSGVAVGRVAVPRLGIRAKQGGKEGKDKEDEDGKWKTNIRLVLDTICKKTTQTKPETQI